MPLKTDYKNDVLDTSKNTKRKYQQTTNSDGTISLDDVTVYSQEGSLLSANDINATNTEVNRISGDLTASDGEPFRYAKQDGKRGILVNEGGADTFVPFSSKADLLWTNPAPNNQFSPQKVSLDLSKYEAVLIETKTSYNIDTLPRGITYINKLTFQNVIQIGRTVGSTSNASLSRDVTAIDNNGVTFGNTKNGTSTDNNGVIPTRIFGLRTALI